MIKTPVVDVIADVSHLPFKSSIFTNLYLSHVLEHLHDPNKALKEVHRVGVDGADITIRVPHALTHSNLLNPTHRIHFVLGTILYWTEFKEFGDPLFTLINIELKTGSGIWTKMLNFCPNIMEHLVFPIWFLNPEIIYYLKNNITI